MLTGDIRNQVDQLWNAFWSGGITNSITVIEQITYLLFLKRLDEEQTAAERQARILNQPLARRIFPEGADELGTPYAHLRWSFLSTQEPRAQFALVAQHVFPFLKTLGGDGTTYAHHMRDAFFAISSPNLLAKAFQLIDLIPMNDRDTKGDVYEYMLGKISSEGRNGQFRTPRHIIQLMVALQAPRPSESICDPASGTCGFLVAAGEYLRDHNPGLFDTEQSRHHFNHDAFHGFDSDSTMLRIGSMNLMLHGVQNPDIQRRDSLAEENSANENKYDLILANPPFAGSLDYESTAKNLQQTVKTKKTELLFLALFLRVLKVGGRAAVIVPDGVLFGSSNAHKALRKLLVEDHKLDAVVSLPSGAFKPYAGVSTAILFFTKTGVGGTDHVWFYDVQADGYSLDDKRTPLLPEDQLGPTPRHATKPGAPGLASETWAGPPQTPGAPGLASETWAGPPQTPGAPSIPASSEWVGSSPLAAENPATQAPSASANHPKNNLPDVLHRWHFRTTTERDNPRTAQSFLVPRAEIAANNYDLSLNRYKQVLHEEVTHTSPKQILAELNQLEQEIQQGLKDLEAMLA